MAAFLADNVFDKGLEYIDTYVDELHICSQVPTTYAEAITTYSLGSKASPTIGTPVDATSGRKVVVSAITDGAVDATNTATHFALVYTGGTELVVTQELASPQAVTDGNPFTTTEFEINIPDPTA